jgi:hypothetical protein
LTVTVNGANAIATTDSTGNTNTYLQLVANSADSNPISIQNFHITSP